MIRHSIIFRIAVMLTAMLCSYQTLSAGTWVTDKTVDNVYYKLLVDGSGASATPVHGWAQSATGEAHILPTVNYEYTYQSGTDATGHPIYSTKTLSFTIDSIVCRECTGLTSVTIPSTVTKLYSLGYQPFYGCTNLTSVSFPGSLTYISGFEYCTSLTNISFPGSVTYISGFDGCSSLANVSFPESVITISGFGDCTSLSSVSFPSSLTGLSGFSGCSNLTSITIPGPNTRIYDNSFMGCNHLESANINGTQIGVSFRECPNLRSLTIGEDVKGIDRDAFMYCALTDLTWNAKQCYSSLYYNYYNNSSHNKSTIERIIIGEGVTVLPNYFACGSSITSITIPNSVVSIGDYAFDGLSEMTGELNIPSSVIYLGDYAFNGCSELTGELNIPDNLESIGAYTFSGCSGLTGHLNIPNNLESIGAGAFYGCSGLTGELNLPNKVKYIGANAFCGCTGLTKVTVGESVLRIGRNAFGGCDGMKELIWNAYYIDEFGLEEYGESYGAVFGYQNNIETITIGNVVQFLPFGFIQGAKITEVTIPSSVRRICYNAFLDCKELKTVHWNARKGTLYADGNESYDYEAYSPFDGCSALEQIKIGAIVQSIGGAMFYINDSDNSLQAVKCAATTPPTITAECFTGKTYNHAELFVPEASLQAYQNAEGWEHFNKCSSIESIPNGDDETMPGDVDGNGMVNMDDLSALINYLLTNNATGIDLENADVDGSGNIGMDDLSALINYLLTNHW